MLKERYITLSIKHANEGGSIRECHWSTIIKNLIYIINVYSTEAESRKPKAESRKPAKKVVHRSKRGGVAKVIIDIFHLHRQQKGDENSVLWGPVKASLINKLLKLHNYACYWDFSAETFQSTGYIYKAQDAKKTQLTKAESDDFELPFIFKDTFYVLEIEDKKLKLRSDLADMGRFDDSYVQKFDDNETLIVEQKRETKSSSNIDIQKHVATIKAALANIETFKAALVEIEKALSN